MAAVCRTVLLADDGMRMHNRLSVLQGDVANQRQQFNLLVERNRWLILLTLPAEPSQSGRRKRAYRLKTRGRQLFLLCEFKQPFRQFVTGLEDKNECFRRLIDLSGLHCSSSIRIGFVN